MLMNMKDLLAPADEEYFAVPAFNAGSGQILKAAIEVAEEKHSPVIIEVHPDELEFQGDAFITYCAKMANDTRIPVCIHLDHGSTYQQIERAIRAGYTSVMIDASRCPFEENIALTKRVVEFAHPLNVSVEAELGTIGIMGNSAEEGTKEITYTVPAEAKEFAERTGVDTLAVGIGTAHGLYPKGYIPKLRLDILKEIKELVKIPLVLHGGSGNPDAEVAEAVKLGINKINISSDIKDPYYQQVRKTLKDQALREPNEIYKEAIEVMKTVMRQKMDLFGCTDAAKYYRL